MSGLNWRRVEEIYDTAVELPPGERGGYLDAACADEPPQVRAQVETLLWTPQEEGEQFLERSLAEAARAIIEETWSLKEGTRLLDRYTIGTVLGVGGMSVVYKATDDKFDPPRAVAIKLISAEVLAGGPKARERFKAEANALAQLKDPRFVRIYDTGEWGLHPFLVMELVEGRSLESRAEARMPPREAAALVASLAGAMSHAHALHIVHRDLKPANVLIDAAGRPRLVDFGLALMDQPWGEADRGEGEVAGTFAYMAPEQANGETGRIGPLTDVFGLGAILYTLLTGRSPYQGADWKATWKQARLAQVTPPRQLGPYLDADLQAVCLKCLQKDPAGRYPSAEELAKDLERWLDGRETKARPWGRVERILRVCRRNPVASALTAATAILLIATAVTAISVAQERKERLVQETLSSNSYLANGIASHVLWQLKDWSKPVVEAARDPKLRKLLKAKDREGLQNYLAILRERPGKGSLFEDWFVVERDQGKLLAISPPRPGLLGRQYDGRDYFAGAMDHAWKGRIGEESVHVSRVFRSEKGETDNDSSEFAISVAVREGDGRAAPALGVLVVTLTTDSKMGLVQLVHERRRAVLIGRGDINPPRPDAEPGALKGYHVLVHPGGRRGDAALQVKTPATEQIGARRREQPEFQPPDVLAFDPGKAIDANYVDPFDNKRQLVGFAQVGNTELAVMVQQQYDQAVEPDIWSAALVTWIGAAALLGLLLAGVIGRWTVRRITNRTASTTKPSGSRSTRAARTGTAAG
jgi:serine/threonine-protein kinase